MSPFQLAWRNLFRRPLSTWIAIFGIAAAVAATGTLLKIYLLSQSRFQTLAHEGQAVVGAKAGGIEILLGSLNLEGPYPGFLPYNLYMSLREKQTVQFEDGAKSQPAGLQLVLPFLYFANFADYRVIGTSPEFLKRPVPEDSPILGEGTWIVGGEDVVLGSEVARARDLHIGSSVHVETTSRVVPGMVLPNQHGFEMKVVGILKPTGKVWDNAIFTSIENAQARLAQVDLRGSSIWGAKVLSYYLIYESPDAFPALRSLIDQRTVGQLINIDDEIQSLEQLTGTGRSFGLLLTLLILFLSSSAVASMMVARFESMSTQLAILRAIGFQGGEIARWLLWEGAILGVVACAIGGAIDLALFPYFRTLSGLNLPSYIPNPILQSVWVWLIAIAVTMAAVTVPLLRLYRQDINASLKS